MDKMNATFRQNSEIIINAYLKYKAYYDRKAKAQPLKTKGFVVLFELIRFPIVRRGSSTFPLERTLQNIGSAVRQQLQNYTDEHTPNTMRTPHENTSIQTRLPNR